LALQLAEKLSRSHKKYQGTTLQGAEEHRRVEVMCQGTTSVVPKRAEKSLGFSPCGTVFVVQDHL
jgi:hypothetical protein